MVFVIDTIKYEAKDGSGKRYRIEIVARQLGLLGNRTDVPKAEASDDSSMTILRTADQNS